MSDKELEIAQIETIEELKEKIVDLAQKIKTLEDDLERLTITFNTHLHGSRFPMTPPKIKMITDRTVIKKEESLPVKDDFITLCDDYKALKEDFIKLMRNYEILHKYVVRDVNLDKLVKRVEEVEENIKDIADIRTQVTNMQQQISELKKSREIREKRIQKMLDMVQEKLEGRE
ncbi:MAG: hypothetical protein ACPLKS_07615 [Caldisericum exile]|uniref:hypothetical protein n=1 Tax=Caldisericum exile TaxID=693075 RepID=UPI003C785BA5